VHPELTRAPSAWRTIAAATALNAPLGAIYAYSVFLKPLESLLGLSRADLAFVFAVAAAVFAVAMNVTPLAFGRASAPLLVLACTVMGAGGIALAASAGGVGLLVLGYGGLFGTAIGVSYILFQQIVNLTVTRRRGLVNGYLTSLLPAGAMLTAPLFGWAIPLIGVRATLRWFAVVLMVLGLASVWLTARAGVALEAATSSVRLDPGERRRAVFWRLWLVFFLAASAGLLVLSQAAGIIAAYGGAAALAVYGTTFITASVAAARIAGGWMVDWLAIPSVAAGAHAVALVGSAALVVWPGAGMSVLALALVGFGYGLISGITAAAIGVYWRRAVFGRMASRIYVAWSAAAIVLPILAGRLFDMTQGYGAAVLIAAGGNLLGILISLGLPRQSAPVRAD
jgi:OFA family oxalate/formate antiporter-like MFS transporter